MNDIKNKNLEVLKEYKNKLYKKIIELEEYKIEGVVNDISVNEEKIVAIQKNDRLYYLNSRYDAKKDSKLWAKKIEETNYQAAIIIMGVANGMYIREALEVLSKDNKAVLYEPDKNIFLNLLENIDMTDVFKDERLHIYVEGINEKSFIDNGADIWNHTIVKYIKSYISPAYKYLYTNQLEIFVKQCYKSLNRIMSNHKTLKTYGEEMMNNAIKNMWLESDGISVGEFKKYINENFDLDKNTVIIVAAGPSLDKNIEELKKAKGKCIIFAVDSAIRKLLEHNIIPDLLITVDGHKPLLLFEDERINDIPLVLTGQSRTEVVEKHTGKKIIYTSDMFTMFAYYEMKKDVPSVPTGGSVANCAFGMMQYVGIKNIILVGQDLAFTNNRKHASNVYKETPISDKESKDYIYVKDNDGNDILTYKNFATYKHWFEIQIENNEELNVINATEGGAKIEGAKVMTLQDAVKEYCVDELDMSFIKNLPPIFEKSQIKDLKNYLISLEKKCDEMIKSFQCCMRKYIELKKLLKQGITSGKKYDKINKDISGIDYKNKIEPVMRIIQDISRVEEEKIMGNLYSEAEGIEGALLVAEHGIDILNVYVDKTRLIKGWFGDVEKCID